MTNTMTSQNIDLSSWDSLYTECFMTVITSGGYSWGNSKCKTEKYYINIGMILKVTELWVGENGV
jgi:hypothetical protein